ncbi:MAG: agmatine deiminase family protein [Pseudomonadota bacterium]
MDIIHEPRIKRVQSLDFVASYVNFYVGNGFVVAATFGDRSADDKAVEALQRHYPGREVITLNVDALGEIGGGIHCATQQMPRTG